MSRRRVLFAAVLLVASLGALLAQVPTRLVGQDRMMFRHRLEGPLQFDSPNPGQERARVGGEPAGGAGATDGQVDRALVLTRFSPLRPGLQQ